MLRNISHILSIIEDKTTSNIAKSHRVWVRACGVALRDHMVTDYSRCTLVLVWEKGSCLIHGLRCGC